MKRIALTFLTLVVIAAAPRAQDVDKLFKAAMNTELVDGNLQAAIEQYKKVVQTGSRALAAQALLRMAECYQKLGDAESRKVYERLVRDYSDQKESAAIARARLGDERGQTAKSTALRKAWAGSNISAHDCGISSDGRYITCPAWETGDLGLHDLATGTDRLLTKNAYAGNQYAQGSAISKDRKHVAYAWFNGKDRYELRLVGLEAPDAQPRTIFDNADIDYLVPSDWSPDGDSVLLRLFRKDRTVQIAFVSVKTGQLTVLKSVDWSSANGLFFSPDGKYIGLDLMVDDVNRNERDVFVLTIDGSRETRVVSYPGHDAMMGWSSDGRYLLFKSDRGSTPGLWAIPIAEGKAAGAAILVKSDVTAQSLGVTGSGALFLVAQVGIVDVQVASIDLDQERVTGAPTSVVRRFVGSNSEPHWSPDGKFLAYVSVRTGGARRRVIVIQSLEKDDTRELDVTLRDYGPIRWAPDGRSFVVKGDDFKGRNGLYQVDAQTGEATRLPFTPGPCADAPEMSPDSKKIYFSGGTACLGREGSVFLEGDLTTGEQREIFRGKGPGAPKLSPDGRFLAGPTRPDDSKTQSVMSMPVSGGPSTELLRLSDGRSIVFRSLSWTPDGSSVIVTVHGKNGNEVLMIPTYGGEPRKIEGIPQGPGLAAVRAHPNGRQIAYSMGQYSAELWVLENFLSPSTSRR
jgi:Tol biopolymer transport system component